MRFSALDGADTWVQVIRTFHTAVMDIARLEGMPPEQVVFEAEVDSTPKWRRWLGLWRSETAALISLCKAGVLAEADESHHQSSLPKFRMRDPDGVGRALEELRVTAEGTPARRVQY
jgi:hypothetical protein